MAVNMRQFSKVIIWLLILNLFLGIIAKGEISSENLSAVYYIEDESYVIKITGILSKSVKALTFMILKEAASPSFIPVEINGISYELHAIEQAVNLDGIKEVEKTIYIKKDRTPLESGEYVLWIGTNNDNTPKEMQGMRETEKPTPTPTPTPPPAELTFFEQFERAAVSGYSDGISVYISKYSDEFITFAGDAYSKYISARMGEINRLSVHEYMINNKLVITDESKMYSAFITAVNLYYPKDNSSSGGGGNMVKSSGGGSSMANPGIIIPIVPEAVKKTDNPASDEYFADLGSHAWSREAVNALYSKGIIAGIEKNIFAPSDFLTREQFTKLVVMLFNYKSSGKKCEFYDVDENAWYYEFINAAYDAGIINGVEESRFGIGESITREQMAVILARAFEAESLPLPEEEGFEFSDIDKISGWALDDVNYIQRYGIMRGNEKGEFMPQNIVTRAEAAVAVYNAYKILP